MARRDRRSIGRRALKRTSRSKAFRFFDLYEAGYSRATIAAKLDLTLEDVEDLFAVVGEHSTKDTVATAGGGES